MSKAKRKPGAPVLIVSSEVPRRIRQHARSESKTEVCGILVGHEEDNGNLRIEACIPGVNAAQGGTHVTFTQDTWEHIYKIKDKDYPDSRILGWYHSHPGFGVFLSDHDTFIHKNFFSSPQQVAWVYDPHTDEEGCFGWVDGRLERLSQLAVSDTRGGEEAGETGKPEPMMPRSEDDLTKTSSTPSRRGEQEPAWLRWTFNILLNLCVFACGFFIAWTLFPRVVPVPVPVDPQTGRIIQSLPEAPAQNKEQSPLTSGEAPGGNGNGKPAGDRPKENVQPR